MSEQSVFSQDNPLEITPRLFEKLHQLCYPKSVAIMGASEKFIKWGSLLTANLIAGGFAGPIYPIHNKAKTVLERPAYPSIQACPGPVDLAFITLPMDKVFAAVEECAAGGVKNLVIVTSGFSEVDKAGAALEQQIAVRAQAAGMRILGPNTMGMISTHSKLYMTGSVATPMPGGISMISQSGNLGAQLVMWADEQGVGINKFFGSGNEADLTATELLAYLGHDESTTAVLLYMEGIEEGRTFQRVAREVSKRKPIVLLKSGRTDDGARAAASHTGALSGSYNIWQGAMRQAGVILVKSPMDLIDGAAGLENLPMPKGNRVCVITLGGGWGVVATDLCREYSLTLPPLPDDFREEMNKVLPPFWSHSNPVDVVGQIDPTVYTTALENAAASDAYDAIITLGLTGSSAFAYDVAELTASVAPSIVDEEIKTRFAGIKDVMEMSFRNDIVNLTKKYGKPIVNVSLDKRHNKVILPTESGKNIVAYNTPEKAVRILAGMTLYQWWKSRNQD